ncbi:ISAzo13 family transposase [Planctomycetota bacterium]
MRNETAGDPITGLKWTRRTTQKIADQLKTLGVDVSAKTVARLLKQMGFSLRVNHKKLTTGSAPDRDEQFAYIAELRERFAKRGWSIASVDTKKKELVGNFKNGGTAWNRTPTLVKDHDFRSDALGIAIPYGVYDPQANRGSVFIGASHDTPQFAVDNIAKWWVYDGRRRYPRTKQLLLLADGGGSNGHRTRAWKHGLQTRVCDRYGLTVTVCHYPTGASKWNPIEHRLFSEISKNWAGKPLDSYETIQKYVRTTATSTGLEVKAYLVPKVYPKGVRISDDDMAQLKLRKHDTQPTRNYTLSPR